MAKDQNEKLMKNIKKTRRQKQSLEINNDC